MNYDTVVFDSDGVLVDPPAPETKLEAVRDALHELGVEHVDSQPVRAIVDGVTPDRLHEICSVHDCDPSEFWNAFERHDERSQHQAFRDGDRVCYEDVTAISELSQRCGVVSNNHHTTIEFVLELFELQSVFDTYYGRPRTIDSLSLKKPNPHYLERALSELEAESALYVGDSETDVLAADRADVDSAFVRRPHRRDATLTVTPTYEISDLHGIEPIVSD